jgi:hypothetical protein
MARINYLVTQQAGAWMVSVDDELVGYANRAAAMKSVLASAESARLHGDQVEVTINDQMTGPHSWYRPAAR